MFTANKLLRMFPFDPRERVKNTVFFEGFGNLRKIWGKDQCVKVEIGILI